jgi:ribose transport system substrate-binding protein
MSKRKLFSGIVIGTLVTLAFAVAALQAGANTTRPKVAFVSADIADPFFITQHCGASVAAKEFNVDLSWQGNSSFDIKQEVSIFNAVLTKSPDAIIVVPFNAQAFVQPVQQALSKNIVVIANNAPLAKNIATRTFLTDEFGLGKLAGIGLGKQLGGKGEVALLAPQTGLFTFDNRMAGFKKGISTYPGLKLVATEYSGGDAGKAAQKTAAILQAHPNLAGIFAVDTTDGEGAGSAILAAGSRGKVKLVAYDASPKEVAGLKTGLYQGLVAQDPYDYGYMAVKFAAQAVRKEVALPKAPKPVVIGGAYIDKNNVSSPKVKKFLYRGSC